MKKVFLLTVLHASASFAGQTGGGGGLGKELTHSAFNLEQLPALYVHDDVLRRAQARLSVEGIDTVALPINAKESIQVKRLQSFIVDQQVTKRFVSE